MSVGPEECMAVVLSRPTSWQNVGTVYGISISYKAKNGRKMSIEHLQKNGQKMSLSTLHNLQPALTYIYVEPIQACLVKIKAHMAYRGQDGWHHFSAVFLEVGVLVQVSCKFGKRQCSLYPRGR